VATKILHGEPVGGGVVTGRVRVVINPRDAVTVEAGEIVVIPHSSPEYAIGVMQAAGLICEYGGVICHICTVAAELGIPCVTEVKGATALLSTSMSVTLDGDNGIVYAA
jgi:pyruvate,water dikinase